MRRGDVILINHPFSHASGAKVRPVLVVSGDRDNRRLGSVIVATITGTIRRAAEPTQLLIELASPEGAASGLHRTSCVVCNNLFSVDSVKIRNHLGRLPGPVMVRVNACLKAALDLP